MRNPLILVLFFLFLGCESKKTYDISSDKVISDLSLRINELNEDLTALENDLEKVKTVLDDKDIDTALRANVRREIHEGKKFQKLIAQNRDYLKIKRKKRYQSLLARKNSETLIEEAEKEIEAYMVDKRLNPMEKPWLNRFRTAVEL